jgi:hypothetical protein
LSLKKFEDLTAVIEELERAGHLERGLTELMKENFTNFNYNELLNYVSSFYDEGLHLSKFLIFTFSLQLCKCLISNKMSFKDVFYDHIKNNEFYIKSCIITQTFNVLKSNYDSFYFLKDKRIEDICYSLAFANVLISFIESELQLCKIEPERVLRKYSEFGSINVIRFKLISVLISYKLKLPLLEECLVKSIQKDLKKRTIFVLFFMAIGRGIKVFLMYI